LRSVPYAYLAWRRIPEGSINDDDGASRVIGRPRVYKGYSRVQTCHGQLGVGEFTLQKRDAPELWKRLRDLEEVPFFRFEYSGDRIVSTGNDSND